MLDQNITDTTCDLGLARTSVGCVTTLASLDPSGYLRAQIIYFSLGAVLLCPAAFLCWRAYANECALLQKRSLLLCVFAAVTFVLRGIDPNGFKHMIPRPIVSFFSDACTAALYSIYVMSLVYWATIIQQGAAQLERPLKIRCLEHTSMAVVWTFYIAVDVLSFLSKGFFTNELLYAQMWGSAALLFLVSAAFLVYGLRVLSRLRVFEQHMQRMRQRAQIPAYGGGFADTQTLDRPESSHSSKTMFVDVVQTQNEQAPELAETRSSHTTRIRRILLVVETFAFIVIVAQVYVGISRTSKPSPELDCANGRNCDKVHCHISVLHWFQAACVVVISWIFRNTQKKERPAASFSDS